MSTSVTRETTVVRPGAEAGERPQDHQRRRATSFVVQL
jgi:hypothetical protein